MTDDRHPMTKETIPATEDTSPGPDGRLAELLDLIRTLRAENGCPWDRKQTPASMGGYLVEEVFELLDAIQRDDVDAVADELGDVLFQAFFIAVLYREAGRLDIGAVLARNVAKMVRRHPHVFGRRRADTPEAVRTQWQEIKAREKDGAADDSALAGIPAGMPALLRAWRVSQRAVAMGFDWEDLAGVMAQAEDEWREFQAELEGFRGADEERRRVELEFGDLLFTLVNVARLARIHPETSLTAAIQKFEARFRHMEAAAAAAGDRLDRMPREAVEALWRLAKRALDG